MSERSKTIYNLRNSFEARTSYIKSKLGILVPSKIKALRLKSDMPRQGDLAKAAKMQQSRISMFETPGAANLTLETLAKLAAAFKLGLVVDFVPFSRMLDWENRYSQDDYDVTRIDDDLAFIVSQPLSINMDTACLASYQGPTSNVSASLVTIRSGEIAMATPTTGAIGGLSQSQAAAGGGR